MSLWKKAMVIVAGAVLALTWLCAEFIAIGLGTLVARYDNPRATEVGAYCVTFAVLLAFLPSLAWWVMHQAAPRLLLEFQTDRDLENLIEDAKFVIARRNPPPKADHEVNGAAPNYSVMAR